MTISPDDRAVLDAWRIGPVASAVTPPTGTMNRTLLLETADSGGAGYALRAYRHADRGRAIWEHTIITHARAQGLPAVAPLPLPGTNGETILERGGRFFALFPLARGRQVHRDALTPGHVTAAGRFLAPVHEALATFPLERSPRRTRLSPDTDMATTLARIARFVEMLRAWPAPGETERHALEHLLTRRRWLEENAEDDGTEDDLADVPAQVIHGDYQETNLFFDSAGGGPGEPAITAIIDWDQATVAPRLWEVVRALHLMFDLRPEPCRAFLTAYNEAGPRADPVELDRVARVYGRMRAHNLWVYEEAYVAGNDRVRPFITPGAFIPFAEQWQRFSTTLE